MYPTKLHTNIKFGSIDGMQAFSADKEFT